MTPPPPPIVLYPGGRRRAPPARPPRILDATGADIRKTLDTAAAGAGVPLPLVLACAIAESSLDPYAERWGNADPARAQAAIAGDDRTRLRRLIDLAWPDISFGYGQRVVRYHYVGDRSASVDNVLRVREYVLDHPVEDLRRMAELLAGSLTRARSGDLAPCDGDELLGALVVYNSGRLPPADDPWWQDWSDNVANYRRALARARETVAVE